MNNHQYEYRKAMDSIHVSKEWEDHMISSLMNAGGNMKTQRGRAPRMGLAAIAAAACLTVGAGAAEATTGAVSDFFAPIFGAAHTEIIDSIGYPVGVSDSAGGVTVTADAIIGDTNNICVIFSLRKNDGSPWTEIPDAGYLHFEDSTLDFKVTGRTDPDSFGAHGSSWFIDEIPGDDVIQFVEERTVDDGTPSGIAKETLKNLCVWDDEAQESRILAKGKWTLRFHLGFEDLTQAFPAGQSVEFLEMPATVTDITVSPISFHIGMEQDRTEYRYSGDPRYLSGEMEAMDQFDIVLRLKDGREIDIGYYAGGSISHDDGKTTFIKSGLFDEVIPVEEMESLIVCGTEIPLPQTKGSTE